MKRKKRIALIITSSLAGLVAISAIGFFAFVGVYYHADDAKIDAWVASNDGKVVRQGDDYLVEGEKIEAGIIIYPGAKVEAKAYLPLAISLAKEGFYAIIPSMPFRLALFGKNRADDYIGKGDIKQWYILGHSLGGAMASHYAYEHASSLSGIAFLAAYADKDLSDLPMKALSIYGSEDRVLNMDAYAKNKAHLPSNALEEVIEGGNHAGFGFYGEQFGDGASLLKEEKQIELTASIIASSFLG